MHLTRPRSPSSPDVAERTHGTNCSAFFIAFMQNIRLLGALQRPGLNTPKFKIKETAVGIWDCRKQNACSLRFPWHLRYDDNEGNTKMNKLFLFGYAIEIALIISAHLSAELATVTHAVNEKESSVSVRTILILFNNNVHLSCAHQCPERSHDTY